MSGWYSPLDAIAAMTSRSAGARDVSDVRKVSSDVTRPLLDNSKGETLF